MDRGLELVNLSFLILYNMGKRIFQMDWGCNLGTRSKPENYQIILATFRIGDFVGSFFLDFLLFKGRILKFLDFYLQLVLECVTYHSVFMIIFNSKAF